MVVWEAEERLLVRKQLIDMCWLVIKSLIPRRQVIQIHLVQKGFRLGSIRVKTECQTVEHV